jgi:hypothetical protein
MTEPTRALTRHDFEAKIVKRCWEDEAFCKAFSTDPVGVFARHLQIPAVSLPKIVVHEETPGSWHIVLPAKAASAAELSDDELEKVAGGVHPTVVIVSGVAVYFIASGSAIITNENGW